MLNLLTQTVATLVNDTTLATLLSTTTPNKHIFTGRVDIVKEQQNTLGFPMLVLHSVSESYVTVPRNTKESRVQIDIWGRNNEAEVLAIYERLAVLLNFTTGDTSGTHTFWQRGDGFNESFESDASLWHLSFDIFYWSK